MLCQEPLANLAEEALRFFDASSQGTCIHLGNCDIGCDVQAKNTLDLNYIPLAERRGAEVRPLHIVRRIEAMTGSGSGIGAGGGGSSSSTATTSSGFWRRLSKGFRGMCLRTFRLVQVGGG